MSRYRAGLVSLLVSGALLVGLYLSIDVRMIGQALLKADRIWLIVSIGMILPITLLRAVRFRVVAPPAALPGLGEALRLTLVSTALNVVVPAKGGDLIKSYFVAKRSETSVGVALAIIVYERLCDLFGLIVWCVGGWLVGRPQVPGLTLYFWVLLGGLGAVCGVLISSERTAALLPAVVALARPRGRLRRLESWRTGGPICWRFSGDAAGGSSCSPSCCGSRTCSRSGCSR